jgi:predicted RNA-binding Zn ribbon-like protein
METDLPNQSITSALVLTLINAPLESGSDLARWLETSARLERGEIQEVALRLPEFQSLRAAGRDVLDASVDRTALPVDAVELLNEVSGRVPRTLVLDPPQARNEPAAAKATARTLARVAWSTIELVGGPDRDRLRRCGSCGDVFLATRADRVWCSNACGNRIRVARHHARRRSPR